MSHYRAHKGDHQIRTTGVTGTVYLLHFKHKYLSGKHHGCQHYIGFTERDVEVRLGEHWSGNGSALTSAVHQQAGNEMILARTWEGVDSSIEFILKCRAESPKLCPVCNPQAYRYASTYEPTGDPQ